ncbi:MAG: ABC transporter permease [Ferruginibacter sp.]
MIKNYFMVAWRTMVRNKAFSAINILGLALGMACSLLIILWVQDERRVDGFHTNGRHLYQVYERWHYDGKVEASYFTQGLLAQELKKVIPEIQFATGMEYAAQPGTQNTFEAGDRINKMEGKFAGADFFSMFSYPLLHGTTTSALSAPGSIAISRRMAESFFGSPAESIGKTIRYENKEDLQVTAVFENIPANSSHQFDFLRAWADFVKENQWVHNWGNTSPETFIQLRKEADPAKVQAKVKDFIYLYQQKDKGSITELALQAYPEKYLNATFKNGYIEGGRIGYVRIFSIVAVFIVLIACINFMNLATARSAKRSKEVGIRKVIGAMRSALIGQFIGEALLLTLLAFMIAVMLAAILLPAFNGLTGKQLTLPVSQPGFWLSLTGLVLATGIVAGSYPALFLSSFNPTRVLKGNMKFSWTAKFFRSGLVVFQFGLSIILIIAMMVIYQQIDYTQSKNLGYDREDLLYIPIEGDVIKNYDLFKNAASKEPGVLSVSKMRNSPTLIGHHTNSVAWPGKDPNLIVSFADGVVGYDFVKTMKLGLVAGRDFSNDFGIDSGAFLVNETAVKKIGFIDPVGKTISWGNRQGKVIGVMKDFHFNSMHQAIDPLILRLDEKWSYGNILVRTRAGQTRAALAGLEKIYKDLNPRFPFDYRFSDQEYAKLYNNEKVVSKMANYFAFLAIFISCLGLFGLATFMAEQRNKEIGVRKVLGASVSGILRQLSSDFLKPVAIALVIAFPVAWYVMNLWLQGFVYSIGIKWWVFAIAGVLTISIALLTVSYQSIKAALANPVKSLRTE